MWLQSKSKSSLFPVCDTGFTGFYRLVSSLQVFADQLMSFIQPTLTEVIMGRFSAQSLTITFTVVTASNQLSTRWGIKLFSLVTSG